VQAWSSVPKLASCAAVPGTACWAGAWPCRVTGPIVAVECSIASRPMTDCCARQAAARTDVLGRRYCLSCTLNPPSQPSCSGRHQSPVSIKSSSYWFRGCLRQGPCFTSSFRRLAQVTVQMEQTSPDAQTKIEVCAKTFPLDFPMAYLRLCPDNN
jgi:hypothetical protein